MIVIGNMDNTVIRLIMGITVITDRQTSGSGWMDGWMDGWMETKAGLRDCLAQSKKDKN